MANIANPDIRKSASSPTREYEEYIARALATEGGHLSIGRGGATLYFERGWLSGCHEERIKAEAIAAGLPVIDSRSVPFDRCGTWPCVAPWSRSASHHEQDFAGIDKWLCRLRFMNLCRRAFGAFRPRHGA